MHTQDRRWRAQKVLKRDAQVLADDARALQRAARAPRGSPWDRAARRGGCCTSAGEALKLLARLEDLNVLADEEGQTEQKGLQDPHLTEMAS